MTAMSVPERKSLWIPWIFIGGMLIVVIVNGVMITLALTTWTGLETKDYYLKGIAYNENLEGARRQKVLGWQAHVSLVSPADAAETHAHEVRVRYANADGNPLSRLSVRAYLVRPVHEGFDREIVLEDRGGGLYAAPTTFSLPGQWDIRLVAQDAQGNIHQMVKRVIVPE
ncbi:MAG: FixH family protein [Rhodospirillales bacterium]|nr:FixH family protein [Rhodospirillales bacterium]